MSVNFCCMIDLLIGVVSLLDFENEFAKTGDILYW